MEWKFRSGRFNWTSLVKKSRQADIAVPCRREDRTSFIVLGRMWPFISPTQGGFTSINVHSKVSTNWDMWRSLSLISMGSSSRTALYSAVVTADWLGRELPSKSGLSKS